MTIRTIKVRQIIMTAEEQEKFIQACHQAREGRTVHQGSVELDDGSQLCVSIETPEERANRGAKTKHPHPRY